MYAILTIIFALVGNINFGYDVQEFSNFFISVLTVIDSSIGSLDFDRFKTI